MGRGSSKAGKSGNTQVAAPLTDAQMEAEMSAEFERIDKVLDDFLYNNPKNRPLDEYNEEAKELDLAHIEKDTLKNLKWMYIDEYNNNVKEYGNGFEIYDEDQAISVLYKDGSVMNVLSGVTDGSKRIPTSNIEGIIVDSGWGSAIAGKGIELVNYREQVDYGKYGYKNIKERYDDFNDIRAEFTVKHPKMR